jgi:hypothetical protein
LQVWDQDARHPSGFDWESVRDCTTPTAGHVPPRRPLTLLDLEQAGKVVVRD